MISRESARRRRKLRQAACVPWNVTVTDGANANAFITSMPALSEDGGRAIVVGSWYGQETFRVFVPLTDGGSYVLSVLWLPNSEYKCTGTPRVCIIVREVMLGLPGAGLEVVPAPLMDGPGFARVALTVGESKALNVQVDVLSEPTMTPTGIRLDVKAAPCL